MLVGTFVGHFPEGVGAGGLPDVSARRWDQTGADERLGGLQHGRVPGNAARRRHAVARSGQGRRAQRDGRNTTPDRTSSSLLRRSSRFSSLDLEKNERKSVRIISSCKWLVS